MIKVLNARRGGSRRRWSVLMLDYDMGELLPIVARLTDKYTSKESSSIRFETARQLMEAVIYCINYNEYMDESNGNSSAEIRINKAKRISAVEAYERGYGMLVENVKRLNVQYSTLLTDFNAYRNQAYYDTIVKGMPAFFLYYDAKFAPQNHILTLDYPTIRYVGEVQGIYAIERYLRYTEYEQSFLQSFPEEYILKLLELHHADYEELLINVCSLVLRNVLICMWIERPISGAGFTREEIDLVYKKIQGNNQVYIEEELTNLLKILIKRGYNNDQELLEYLSYDIHEFTIELWNAALYDSVDTLLGEKKV